MDTLKFSISEGIAKYRKYQIDVEKQVNFAILANRRQVIALHDTQQNREIEKISLNFNEHKAA